MKFRPTPLDGCFLIEQEPRGDDRGFFARLYCTDEFKSAGLPSTFAQVNNAFSKQKGTLRGLHYQLPPSAESKLVRCISGSVFDCVVDLRPDSVTFGKWFGAELTSENRLMLYVPKGFAHGYQTLADDTELIYLVDEFYAPHLEGGLKWDDPQVAIDWPLEPSVLSPKDQSLPAFSPENYTNLTGLTSRIDIPQ